MDILLTIPNLKGIISFSAKFFWYVENVEDFFCIKLHGFQEIYHLKLLLQFMCI